MAERYLRCPYCNEDDFDEIGLWIHLERDCEQFGDAGTKAREYLQSRMTRKPEDPSRGS